MGISCFDWRLMKPRVLVTVFVSAILALFSVTSVSQVLSVCDYEPPESLVSSLGFQGSFSWFDGPYTDDQDRVLAASLTADYSGLRSSESSAQQLVARTEIRGRPSGWTAKLAGSGSLLSFLDDSLFAVGAFGLDASNEISLEIDLTGGIGTGRFRDVTPLAQAILIQNALLDVGELLAPISNAALLELAQILGEIGPSDEERIVSLVERLEATELIRGDGLDIRGLLEIDRILDEADTSRLCGNDVQARIGASALLLPELRISSTAIIQARYALVPDPVSQVEADAAVKVRLSHLEQMSIEAGVSYGRRLPDGWTARAEYRLDIDRMWTDTQATVFAHAISSSLTTQVFGSVGLSLVANAEYRTGDEEITFSFGLHLEADLF